jgi:hypothetical protein
MSAFRRSFRPGKVPMERKVVPTSRLGGTGGEAGTGSWGRAGPAYYLGELRYAFFNRRGGSNGTAATEAYILRMACRALQYRQGNTQRSQEKTNVRPIRFHDEDKQSGHTRRAVLLGNLPTQRGNMD